MEKKIKVEYSGGQSRLSTKNIDYMLANVNEIELYAEADFDENRTDDTDTYEELKAEILLQAKENGVSEERLVFMYD